MLAISVLTTLCTTGIAFYVRFLIALCKECAPHWFSPPSHVGCDWRRLGIVNSNPPNPAIRVQHCR